MAAIGVFDSGVGGLTVLKALKAKFPGEDFVYLADTARLPYGSKSLATIKYYVEQNINFLLKEYSPKAIVVACNSASSAILENQVQADVPIMNVIEPGARAALKISTSKRIGVLATRATVNNDAYPKVLAQLDSSTKVFQQAGALLVPLVEEGWIDDPVTGIIVYRYASVLTQYNVDTVILGCTHYPILRTSIQKALGNTVALVDSTNELIEDFKPMNLKETGNGKLAIVCTDFSPRLEETTRLLLGPIPVDSLKTVHINGLI